MAISGSFSLTDSPGANYLASTDSLVQITNPVDLTGQEGCRVKTYNAKLGTEANVDTIVRRRIDDNSTWTPTANHSGSTGAGYWPLRRRLPPFDGSSTA